jgi:hypothetical protein
MLSNQSVQAIGACLLIIGIYDTCTYAYSLKWSRDTFDFFGHKLHPKHPLIISGFLVVLAFYLLVGAMMLVFG